METYIGWLVGAVVIVALVVIGGRAIVSRIVRGWTLWRLSQEERAVFAQKVKLLENTAIVEFVTPAVEFQREYSEDEKRRNPQGWMTPWPKAIQAAWKKHKGSNKRVDVRAQVRAAAQEIYVGVLPEERQPSNAGDGHFLVAIPLGNRPEEQVRGLQSLIKGKLGLHSVEVGLSADYLEVEFVCHTEKPEDALESRKIGASFFQENPATSPALLPLAVDENGCPWSLPLFHTLIYGLSGAGKGSVLNGIICQLSTFVKEGTVVLYGIDPKFEDLDEYRMSSLFEKVVSEQEACDEMLRSFYNRMKKAQRDRQLARAEGRPLPEVGTVENPHRVLILDEGVTYLLNSQEDRKSKDIMPKFTEIMNAGRSGGFWVVLAAQNIDKELLGRLRGGFSNGITLRSESEWYTDVVLGKNATANGFDATAIRPANAANRYVSAGIGYVKEQSGAPIKVRFAFTSKEDVRKLVEQFPMKEADHGVSESVPAPVASAPRSSVVSAIPEHSQPTPLPSAVRAPAADSPSKASVTDRLATILLAPDAELKARGRFLKAALSERENPQQRHMLQEIARELRIRRQLADMPKVQPDPESIVLPDLSV